MQSLVSAPWPLPSRYFGFTWGDFMVSPTLLVAAVKPLLRSKTLSLELPAPTHIVPHSTRESRTAVQRGRQDAVKLLARVFWTMEVKNCRTNCFRSLHWSQARFIPKRCCRKQGDLYFFCHQGKISKKLVFNLCTSEPKQTGHSPVESSGENIISAPSICNFNYASDMSSVAEELKS